MRKNYLTPSEVAGMLRVAPVTVRMWSRNGMLKAETTPGGHRRYQLHEIRRFAAQHDILLQTDDEDLLRVLIVDDDEFWRDLLKEVLEAADEKVVTDQAADGFAAGQKIHSFRPHLVLLDLMLPGINGIEVCRSIKADPETRSIRIIGITGFFSEEIEQELLQAGAEYCLSKPVDHAELMVAIGLTSSV